MERFDELGLAERLLARGVKVRRGRAVGQGGPLGTLDFGVLPGRFPFALSCPQDATEALLQEAVQERLPGAVRRGGELVEGCYLGSRITRSAPWGSAMMA